MPNDFVVGTRWYRAAEEPHCARRQGHVGCSWHAALRHDLSVSLEAVLLLKSAGETSTALDARDSASATFYQGVGRF